MLFKKVLCVPFYRYVILCSKKIMSGKKAEYWATFITAILKDIKSGTENVDPRLSMKERN